MNIFYIAHFDCTTDAGHAAHVRGVINALDEQGHKVWLFAGGWQPRSDSNVRFIHVPQLRRPHFFTLSYAFASIPILIWWLLRVRPEIVYTRFFNTLFISSFIFRILRVPYVVELNADQQTEHDAFGRNNLRRSFWDWSERTAYCQAAGIVAVAPAIIDSVKRRFPDIKPCMTVIENGVDTTDFYPQEREVCRRHLGLDIATPYIVYVGAFQVYQGLLTLVKAARIVIEQMPKATFILVGDGPEREKIEISLKELNLMEHFLLPGGQSPQVAAQYIGASDICVAPYNRLAAATNSELTYNAPLKGSPMKIFTYLACARPVIASYFREAGAFVWEIDAGLAAPPDDPKALGTAILELLNNGERAAQMGKNGYERVHLQHSWRAVTSRLVEFLTVTLNHHEKLYS
jgi:glycosyltransferase involved in cell wall biosynthesis